MSGDASNMERVVGNQNRRRTDVYDPSRGPRRTTRRRFIGESAIVTGAAVATAIGLSTIAAWSVAKTGHETLGVIRTREEYSDLLDNKAKRLITGETDIASEVRFRTKTSIPEGANVESNIVKRSMIKKINGVEVMPNDAFKISNAPLLDRNNGQWMFVIATLDDLGVIRDQVLYASVGYETEAAKVIVPNRDAGARFYEITEHNDREIILRGHDPVPKNEVGKVTLPLPKAA